MTVSKNLRYEILRRDNHTCRYCGASAPDVKLEVDHIVPVTLGGSDDPANLVTACAACNAGKSARPATEKVVQDVDQDTLKWADALRRVAEIERANRDKVERVLAAFWDEWTSLNNQWAYPPPGWDETIEKFLAAGLDLDDLSAGTHKAATTYGVTQRNRWRYFCGICWRKVEQRQEAARALLSADDDSDPR
jgi:hypothetical protein